MIITNMENQQQYSVPVHGSLVLIYSRNSLKYLGLDIQGPVVRRPIITNLDLNFTLGFFFFCCSKSIYLPCQIVFPILFRVSNHQIVDRKN